MGKYISSTLRNIDWYLVACIIPLLIMSVLTMSSFEAGGVSYAGRQLIWIGVSVSMMLFLARSNLSILKESNIVLTAYISGILLLIGFIFFGSTINGSTSWYSFGFFSFQPSDLAKLFLILILAKYLARRHVAIKSMKHLLITGLYFVLPFFLIFIQPDFGSAAIFIAIWFGMILISGISKKHITLLAIISLVLGVGLWFGVLKDYQKARITSFLDPLSDIQGAGYNAYQSMIAVGSGEVWGKGVGYGTQSRLSFLPEYQTDFIFASVSEEWGFIGSVVSLLCLLGIIARILYLGLQMNGNFELLYAVGVAVYFLAHVVINIGMNIGVLPVTGVTLPFLSYGGSHLIIEFMALGILMSFKGGANRIYADESPELFLR